MFPVTRQANRSLTPRYALEVTNGCPPTFRGLEVSFRDFPQRVLLQLGISRQPFEAAFSRSRS